jgi:hypothetical protein
MKRSEQEAYQRGYEMGFSEGYTKGRVAGAQDARAESRSAPPEDSRKGNGWVTASEGLRERFSAPEGATRAYILRDMTGEIVGVQAWE